MSGLFIETATAHLGGYHLPQLPASSSIIKITRIGRLPPRREFAKFCNPASSPAGRFGSTCWHLPDMMI